MASLNARWAGFMCLLVTTFGWGLNWPAVKIVLREWPPFFSRGLAGVAAALILAAIAHSRGERLAVPPALLPRLLLLAMTNVFFWMGLGTVMMQWLSVAEGALLVYTMPIWSMLLSWPLLGTRPTLPMVTALLLGIAGTAILLGGGLDLGTDKAWGVAIGLSSAILFALGGILNRKPLPIPPFAMVAWQVGLGCLPMVLIGVTYEWSRIAPLSPLGWTLQLYMTLVPMGLAYVTWFAALRLLSPATASLGTLLVPPIGIVAAGLTLGEPLGWRVIAALALTLSGVALALRSTSPPSQVSDDP